MSHYFPVKDSNLVEPVLLRMKGSKLKIVDGQIFEKAAYLGPYLEVSHGLCPQFTHPNVAIRHSFRSMDKT